MTDSQFWISAVAAGILVAILWNVIRRGAKSASWLSSAFRPAEPSPEKLLNEKRKQLGTRLRTATAAREKTLSKAVAVRMEAEETARDLELYAAQLEVTIADAKSRIASIGEG